MNIIVLHGVLNSIFKQVIQGLVVTYNVWIRFTSGHWSSAFCSACTAIQLSKDSPEDLPSLLHGLHVYNPLAGPLYPVDNT